MMAQSDGAEICHSSRSLRRCRALEGEMAPTTTRQLTYLARLLAVLLLLALSAGIGSARSDVGGNPAASKQAPAAVPKGSAIGKKAVSIAKHYLGVKYRW